MMTKLLQGWNFLTNLNVLLKKRTIIVKIREKMMDLFWQETTVDVYNNIMIILMKKVCVFVMFFS